jgi:hypothetical protein
MEPNDREELPFPNPTGDSNSGTQAGDTNLSPLLTSALSRAPESELPMLYCPVCSQRLASRQCKLFCERCGYYMSCADYY